MKSIAELHDLGDELCDHCPMTDYGTEKVNTSQHNQCEGRACIEAYENYCEEKLDEKCMLDIKRAILSKPATIIIWEDDSKTVVKLTEEDTYNKKYGILMAYFQKGTGLTKRKASQLLEALVKEGGK